MSSKRIYDVSNPDDYKKAGPTDLVRLGPVSGTNPIYQPKQNLEIIVHVIVGREVLHLSGPTGSAKSSLIEALTFVPGNFATVCRELGFEPREVLVFPVEMAPFESPGELWGRRALKNGSTCDEDSLLIDALLRASKVSGDAYPVVFLREMGRVQSAQVQGGLLDIITRHDVLLGDGRSIDTSGVAWVADSNYQAEDDSEHVLVTFDEALKRRFTVNMTLDYLSSEQEMDVLRDLVRIEQLPQVSDEVLAMAVKLGQLVRNHRAKGNLQSVVSPTIYGYMAFVRMTHRLPHLSPQEIACVTLLGNASREDRKNVVAVCNEVFGLQAGVDESPLAGEGLF